MSKHEVLDSLAHRDLRVRIEAGEQLGDAVMACLVMPAEFRQVQAQFPIVFRRDIETGAFSALALLGFENGENLFLAGDHWDAAYKPLALAVQPFLIGRTSDPGQTPQVHVDMDSPRIVEGGDQAGEGVRVFEEAGQPSPLLETVAQRLGDLDHAYRTGGAFFEALASLDILEPFSLDVPLVDGSNQSLVGFHCIDEEKLRALDAATLGELHGAGHLMPMFMALASLSQFNELVARKNLKVSRA